MVDVSLQEKTSFPNFAAVKANKAKRKSRNKKIYKESNKKR